MLLNFCLCRFFFLERRSLLTSTFIPLVFSVALLTSTTVRLGNTFTFFTIFLFRIVFFILFWLFLWFFKLFQINFLVFYNFRAIKFFVLGRNNVGVVIFFRSIFLLLCNRRFCGWFCWLWLFFYFRLLCSLFFFLLIAI